MFSAKTLRSMINWVLAEQGDRMALESREVPAGRLDDLAHAIDGTIAQDVAGSACATDA
jgi:hypothetical protein